MTIEKESHGCCANSILTRYDFETLRFQEQRFKSVTLEKEKREKKFVFILVYLNCLCHHRLNIRSVD